jgi:hypothetical protein
VYKIYVNYVKNLNRFSKFSVVAKELFQTLSWYLALMTLEIFYAISNCNPALLGNRPRSGLGTLENDLTISTTVRNTSSKVTERNVKIPPIFYKYLSDSYYCKNVN